MSYYAGDYDVAVIGAGHAGCEAGLAAARLGMKTLVFSISLEAVANMPCNPHIGGSSKGHLVREFDCLGGEMGKNIDKTFVQMRMLNTSKGPAVYSLRAQADRKKYQMEMKHTLELQENLDVKQAEIVEYILKDGKIAPIGFLSGLSDEIKANFRDYAKKPIEITCMEIQYHDDGRLPGLRHAKFLQFRPDLNIEECIWEKIFG